MLKFSFFRICKHICAERGPANSGSGFVHPTVFCLWHIHFTPAQSVEHASTAKVSFKLRACAL
jgi:hypothetical protein